MQPGTRGHNAAVIGQSQSLLIPRGIPVRVQVHDPAGYGIADARVVATNKDRIKLHEVPLVTDAGGFADFAQLQVGSWHIVVEKDGFHRIDFTLMLKAGQDPVSKQVKLIRAR